MSRICMVVPGTKESIPKLLKQLSKLVYVRSLDDLTDTPFVNRELLLVKVCVGCGVGWWGGVCSFEYLTVHNPTSEPMGMHPRRSVGELQRSSTR